MSYTADTQRVAGKYSKPNGWYESGMRIIVSVIAGTAVTALIFNLGVPRVVGLCIGATVVGIVLALMKDSDEGPTATT